MATSLKLMVRRHLRRKQLQTYSPTVLYGIASLPAEILSLILQNLVLTLHPRQHPYSFYELSKFPAYYDLALQSSESRYYQCSFTCVLLVCKNWYWSGVGLLYERPIIESSKSLHIFAHTLRKRHVLTGLVRSIVIVDSDIFGPETTICSRVLRKEKRHRYRYVKSLAAVLNSCNLSHSLDLRPALCASPVILDPSVSKPNQLKNLKRLSLYGYQWRQNPFVSSDMDFVSLEDLSLEAFCLDEHFQWPQFPSLRCIRIAHCECLNSSSTSLIPTGLPSLQTVELFNVWPYDSSLEISHDVTDVLQSSYAETLESLQIGGNWSTPAIHWLDFSLFTKLKRLVFVVDIREGLSVARLPDSLPRACHLEELAIICIPDWRWEGEASVAEEIVELMENARLLPTLTRLRIEGDHSIWERKAHDANHGSLAETLRLLCNARSVELKLHLYHEDRIFFVQ